MVTLHDGWVALGWVAVLVAGAGLCAALFRLGVPRTFVRDLLHVGAGVWVLGWPFWQGWLLPVAIPALATAALATLPNLARRVRPLSRFAEAVSDEDERWSGLVLYAVAFAALTPLGLVYPFAAGGALLALALGDGIGGAVGRALGRTRFAVPGAKQKSWEGVAAVAAASAAGIALAGWYFAAAPAWWVIAGGAVVSAAAEAVSPRASDNVVVPAAVFALLFVAGP